MVFPAHQEGTNGRDEMGSWKRGSARLSRKKNSLMLAMKTVVVFVAWLAIFLHRVRAEIQSLSVSQSTGPFGYYIINDFGVGPQGIFNIDYNVVLSDLSTASTVHPNSYILILVLTKDEIDIWYSNLDKNDQNTVKDNIRTLCNRPSFLRRTVSGKGSFSYTVPTILGAQQFSVAMLQCETVYQQQAVDVSVTVEVKNFRPYSENYSQLPLDEGKRDALFDRPTSMYNPSTHSPELQWYASDDPSGYSRRANHIVSVPGRIMWPALSSWTVPPQDTLGVPPDPIVVHRLPLRLILRVLLLQ